ncbi:MAG: EAL domain-containing protein [Chromatiaceae bacterium]|jgi:diguanylate cyclase (GGDEF)-like protein/PAS domain S-box-containing protein
MFSRLSLKYRIALIIFLMESVLMAAVLWETLGASYADSTRLIQGNEQVIVDLVGEDGRSALITEEYIDFQTRAKALLARSEAVRFHLADDAGTVVASSEPMALGSALTSMLSEGSSRWEIKELESASGPLGSIAVQFSDQKLLQAYTRVWLLGVSIALGGMLFIAIVGVAAGHFLTRRLTTISETANRVAGGDLNARTRLTGHDELGRLARSFDQMVGTLKERDRTIEIHVRELTQRERDLEITLNSIGDAVIATDAEGRVIRMNPIAEQLTGWSYSDAAMRRLTEVFPIIDATTRLPISNPVDQVLATGQVVYLSNHTTLIDKSGNEYQISDSAAPIRDDGGRIQGIILVFKDFTEQYDLREKAKDAQDQLQGLLNNMRTMVAILDTDGTIDFVNQAPMAVLGIDVSNVLQKKLWDIPGFASDSGTVSALKECVGQARLGFRKARDLQFKTPDRNSWISVELHPVRDGADTVTQILVEGRDISERKEAEEKIYIQAHYDELTGLPNRFLSLDRLKQLINESQRTDELAAVLFIDLDDFKKVNDTLGHETGDKLLVEAADRLSTCVRSSDTVGRLGGDEFIVLLAGLDNGSAAQPIAEHLLNRFRGSFLIDGRELTLTLSIGISVYPNDGENASDLLRNADVAMYHAKEQGRNSYYFFADSMNKDVSRRLAIEEQMHGAIERGEFAVHYQPQIDIATGEMIGSEALLRWQNPALGAIPPTDFIGIAEQTGYISALGVYVLRQAISTNAQWRQATGRDMQISVNLSPRQFRDTELVSTISDLLREHDMPGGCLELEITEGLLMAGTPAVNEALSRFNALGVRIAMDDFGTGYASMSNLRRYPFDALKIDRSFIQDIATDEADQKLVAAAVAMAHALGLKVVAEGVETDSQLKILRRLQCDFAQGFLFAKPLPAAELRAFVQAPPSFS